MDPSDCWNLSKRVFKDYKWKGYFAGGLLGFLSWYKRFLFCLVYKKYVLSDSFLSVVYSSHPQFPISICTEDCIFVYFLFEWIFTGTIYIINGLCKNPDTLKFTWRKKIRGCVMHCRQADTQWQTKNIAACNRINAIQQSWQLWWFSKSC
jgi:hypothetical protein